MRNNPYGSRTKSLISRIMKKLKFTPFQIIVHLLAWVPLAWLLFDYFTDNLTFNWIQAATQRTGRYALILLILSLACTPLNTIFGFRKAIKVRRALGLYAFMYAVLHFAIFAAIDYGFDWQLLKIELLERRYIYIGATVFTILFALAVTSFKWWMKKLGKKWMYLHKLVYLAGTLVVLHYAWAKKGDIFRLQGDILAPLAAGIIIALLLFLRIPPVRKATSKIRWRIQRMITGAFVIKEPANT